ncbi:MAG TPA: FG-GAP-like repeat-containing protein [Terriglobales bacterium]
MRWTPVIAFSLVFSFALVLVSAAPEKKPAAPAIESARLNNLGAAYMNQQLFEKGLKSFELASSLDSKLVIARVNQGIALANLQRVDAATKILQEASQETPRDPYVWYNLGLLYKNSGNPQAAADAFKKVTEIDPNDADSWYMLGTALLQAKQIPQAEEAFQHALKINPLHASAEFGFSRALQESGDTPQARVHLVRFQYITKNKLGAPMSLAYGEQGKYSRAEESGTFVQSAPPMIQVTFKDETQSAGLATSVSTARSQELAPFLGPGACFLDFDGDGRLDLLFADGGKQGGVSLYHNLGSGRFEDVTKKAGLDPALHAVSCASADYDNDGATDFALALPDRVLLFHNEKNGTFKDVTEAAGIKNDGPNVSLTFIDYDHDGDLDLFVTRTLKDATAPAPGEPINFPSGLSFPGNQMWRNNGNGTFTEVTSELGLSADPSMNAMGTDYNNDRAVDLLVTDVKGPVIFENPREGKFLARTPWPSAVPNPVLGTAVLDFDHDGWMDIAFTSNRARGLTLWRNRQAKSFDPVTLPATNWARAWGVAALDYDNDGWIDLAAVGETKDGKGEIKLFRNLGADGFKDVTAEVGLDKIQLKNPRALITGDYDGDGATDLLITQNHGPAVLLRNDGGNKNHWLRLSLKGLNDNKSAIGTKVEVFAGGNRQKWEIAGSNGYLGQNSTEIIAGLGKATQADVVRMLWPTGVLQDEIEVAAGQHKNYIEIDRRGSSCPTLFVWEGHHYALVGDMIGAAVVGHWIAPGQRNIPRPVEYMKVDRNVIREKDGKLSFRFMEPLEEAVYLDQVQLLAVDHPSDLAAYPNEYFASNPPYPPFKVVFSRDAKPPASAWDEHGHNLLPDLLAHRFVGDFDLLPFAGFTKLHSLELDLGDAYRGGPLWLLMHGEIEYFTATGMYAADQAGLQPIAPYLETLGADGKWKRVIDDMGFPAGGARTMTADLSGKLPAGTKRIRISTNLQIYWDNILIDRTSQNQPAKLTEVPLARADLRFHGFPLKIEDQPPGNVKYVYEKASATGPYTRPAGAYTRYGDVLPLLTKYDDRLAVFGSGDEVALEFDPTRLPAVPPGWTRDYFFAARGYEKDMDFYAFDPTSVEPLPFGNMGSYPYPGKQYPLDEHLGDLLEYNTRFMSGNEARGYAFHYEPH